MNNFKKNNGSIVLYILFGIVIIISVFLFSVILYRDYIIVNQYKSSNAQINRISSMTYTEVGEKKAKVFAKDMFNYFNPNAARYLDGKFNVNFTKNNNGLIENNTEIPLKLPSVFNKILPNNELKKGLKSQSTFSLGKKSDPVLISFILDYSASMGEGSNSWRIQALKQSVMELIDNMAKINKEKNSDFFKIGLYPFQTYTYTNDCMAGFCFFIESSPFSSVRSIDGKSNPVCNQNSSVILAMKNRPDTKNIFLTDQQKKALSCDMRNLSHDLISEQFLLHAATKVSLSNMMTVKEAPPIILQRKIAINEKRSNSQATNPIGMDRSIQANGIDKYKYIYTIKPLPANDSRLDAFKTWNPSYGTDTMTNSLYGILSALPSIFDAAILDKKRKQIIIVISDGVDSVSSDNGIYEICQTMKKELPNVEFYQLMFDKALSINPLKDFGCVKPKNSILIQSQDKLKKRLFSIINQVPTEPIMTKM